MPPYIDINMRRGSSIPGSGADRERLGSRDGERRSVVEIDGLNGGRVKLELF
mgnify:CR=1 FL=1